MERRLPTKKKIILDSSLASSLDSRYLRLVLSLFIVAFGAPSLSWGLSMATAAFGYALFWKSIQGFSRPFWLGTSWFAATQLVQWSWVTSTHYMGPLIIVAYLLYCLLLGFQFGALTLFARPPYRWLQVGALSGGWALLEWGRLFFLSGCFVWNPIGLSLAANDYSIQLASAVGMFGLCFWVVMTNLALLKSVRIGFFLAIFPYLFGFCHQKYFEFQSHSKKQISVALVQTALKPEQRDLTLGNKSSHIAPLEQWRRILSALQKSGQDHFDLIILPEGALPHGARRLVYPLVQSEAMKSEFGLSSDALKNIAPYGQGSYVTNSYWLQSLANHYQSEVIVGLEDDHNGAVYNSAFHFLPFTNQIGRYQKQILMPIGEYIPFTFLASFFSDHFGIRSSFASGNATQIFEGNQSIGISICIEEIYGEMIRKSRLKGADLLVNITNDVWFPDSRLTWQHFDHGRVRAAENGAYLLRACNTGVTAVVDCFGHAEKILPISENGSSVLAVDVSIHSHGTFYTFWGDLPILLLSGGLGLIFLLRAFWKKKLLRIGVVN